MLHGYRAQGSVLGNWEYLSQTNNNTDHIPVDSRWMWVDDLTTLEVLDLKTIGLSFYNFCNPVALDIPVQGQYVDPAENLRTQQYISTLKTWSDNIKKKLNEKQLRLC